MLVFTIALFLFSILLVACLRRKTDPRPLWDATFEEKPATEKNTNPEQPENHHSSTPTTPAGLAEDGDQASFSATNSKLNISNSNSY
jgi:hypothetical protein